MAASGYDHHPAWGLIMAGGRDANWELLDAVVTTKDGAKFEKLTPLPTPMSRPCLVAVDENTLVVAGGYARAGFTIGQRAYIYDRMNRYVLL